MSALLTADSSHPMMGYLGGRSLTCTQTNSTLRIQPLTAQHTGRGRSELGVGWGADPTGDPISKKHLIQPCLRSTILGHVLPRKMAPQTLPTGQRTWAILTDTPRCREGRGSAGAPPDANGPQALTRLPFPRPCEKSL